MLLRKITGPALATKFLSVPPKENLMDHQCVCVSECVCVCVYVYARARTLVTHLCLTLCDPMTVALQAPLSREFSQQEHWSGLPFPSPENLPDPGIEPRYPALHADCLSSEPPGNCTRG